MADDYGQQGDAIEGPDGALEVQWKRRCDGKEEGCDGREDTNIFQHLCCLGELETNKYGNKYTGEGNRDCKAQHQVQG